MSRKALQPVTVDGIEFDALIEEQKTYNSTIPSYPVESGFSVSDTIILEPINLQMTLYVSNTPVTWLHRHGSSVDRVNKVCEALENLWFAKKLVKVVTRDAIYTNMGISSISIKKSKEIGYAREVQLQLQKVTITTRKVVTIPSYAFKAGATEANAGTATTAITSSNGASRDPNGSTNNGNSASKNAQSTLYGMASGMNFM